MGPITLQSHRDTVTSHLPSKLKPSPTPTTNLTNTKALLGGVGSIRIGAEKTCRPPAPAGTWLSRRHRRRQLLTPLTSPVFALLLLPPPLPLLNRTSIYIYIYTLRLLDLHSILVLGFLFIRLLLKFLSSLFFCF